ncbi:MAG: hypothetical protein VST71_06565 [Nitrospirota bacterium]|nr:hypothetical protein [Nitrospirota bacterium]
MRVENTRDGKIAILSNPALTRYEEYSLVSLFRDSNTFFAQLIGQTSPKRFLGPGYAVERIKIDSRNNLYTLWFKDRFRYKFPIPKNTSWAIVAPCIEAAEMILQKLVGIYDKVLMDEYFSISALEDECENSDRVALVVSQMHPGRRRRRRRRGDDILEEFKTEPKNPLFFTGGMTGVID